MKTFSILPSQQKIIDKWLDEVAYPRAIEIQKAQFDVPCEDCYGSGWVENPGLPYGSSECPMCEGAGSDWPDTIEIYKSSWEAEFPYYGMVGGGVEYTFIPTSVGPILRVKETISGEELTLTEQFG